ncbi:dimethylargininase [Tenggerimyces flavus]|uniref:Dimethylargininase n=1 Tax=Tenggerimyces flavus TaxID=1708749 RepID=A0ABV7YKA9_9ACTN|nr:dimethylargininase [Tenggerimyces flavus]MBM7787531.1 N-dimethylarginine dimethylaminohydrolase [Tenggerimyces flavus]
MSTQARTNVAPSAPRIGSRRHYLMCRPTYFTVEYAINPWMHPEDPADAGKAIAQWENLRRTYLELGHEVSLIDPVDGLPDMVFAANGATVVDGKVFGARFRYAERAAEGEAYLAWFKENADKLGVTDLVMPTATVEGEGDLLTIGDKMLAGTGFRTDVAAHAELAAFLDREVVTLHLVDPRFYHLDTALSVLDSDNVAYYPKAFAPQSLDVLRRLFPDAVLASDDDAVVLGLNAVSDGRRVVLPEQATGLIGQLTERGYEPVPVDLSELRKAGGGPKCCTLEIRS